jgi:hypothetical protein
MRRKIYIIIALLFVVIVAAILFCFGNPQWHKHIYMFQAYILPKIYGPVDLPKLPNSFTGTWTDWDKNGNKISIRSYYKSNLHGKTVFYYKSGQIKSVHHSKLGKAHGVEKFYYKNGKIKLEQLWKDHLLDGKSTDWNLNGQKKRETFWKGGAQHGVDIIYNDDGTILAKGEWLSGTPWEGVCEIFDDSAPGGKKLIHFSNGVAIKNKESEDQFNISDAKEDDKVVDKIVNAAFEIVKYEYEQNPMGITTFLEINDRNVINLALNKLVNLGLPVDNKYKLVEAFEYRNEERLKWVKGDILKWAKAYKKNQLLVL